MQENNDRTIGRNTSRATSIIFTLSLIILIPWIASASNQPWSSGLATSFDRSNVAAAANGGTVVGSSTKEDGNFHASSTIDGDRKGLSWSAGGGWADGTPGAFPDTLEVQFSGVMVIDEINVVTIQDTWWDPVEPTDTLTFFNNGITDFEVQYWDGSSWLTIPGGLVTGNAKIVRKFTFAPITTEKIRVNINAGRSTHSIVIEFEAFGEAVAPPVLSPKPVPVPLSLDGLAAALWERDIFIDPSNNVGFGTSVPIFNDDGITGASVGKWVAIDGKVPGAAAYLGIGGFIPKPGDRVGALNFYNMAMGGVDNRTASIFSFNGPTLGTGYLEFSTSPSSIGPVRRMQISPTGEVGINHDANPGTMLQVMGRTADASTYALGVLNGADRPLLTVRNDGMVTVSEPGQGVVLKSPDGLTCRKLTIDNTGNLEVQNMPSCP